MAKTEREGQGAAEASQPRWVKHVMGARDALLERDMEASSTAKAPLPPLAATGTIEVPSGLLPRHDAPQWVKEGTGGRKEAATPVPAIPGAPWSDEEAAPVPAIRKHHGTVDLEGEVEQEEAVQAQVEQAPAEAAITEEASADEVPNTAASTEDAGTRPEEPAPAATSAPKDVGGDPYGNRQAWPTGPRRGTPRTALVARKPKLDFNRALYRDFVQDS